MKLWGGNYTGDLDRDFWEFNRSFPFDRRLLREEIAASRAYVRALGRCQAIPTGEADRLDTALEHVAKQELAGQAHLGRSRNEQAVTALRLWMRAAVDRLRVATAGLVQGLCAQGEAGADAVMPGFTHTRAAEPITFGHFAAAHAWG